MPSGSAMAPISRASPSTPGPGLWWWRARGELAYGRDRLPDAGRWFNEDPRALGAMAERMKVDDPSRPVLVLAKPSSWKQLSAEEKARWEEVARSPVAVVARRQ